MQILSSKAFVSREIYFSFLFVLFLRSSSRWQHRYRLRWSPMQSGSAPSSSVLKPRQLQCSSKSIASESRPSAVRPPWSVCMDTANRRLTEPPSCFCVRSQVSVGCSPCFDLQSSSTEALAAFLLRPSTKQCYLGPDIHS